MKWKERKIYYNKWKENIEKYWGKWWKRSLNGGKALKDKNIEEEKERQKYRRRKRKTEVGQRNNEDIGTGKNMRKGKVNKSD